jgi:hypothetical protein
MEWYLTRIRKNPVAHGGESCSSSRGWEVTVASGLSVNALCYLITWYFFWRICCQHCFGSSQTDMFAILIFVMTCRKYTIKMKMPPVASFQAEFHSRHLIGITGLKLCKRKAPGGRGVGEAVSRALVTAKARVHCFGGCNWRHQSMRDFWWAEWHWESFYASPSCFLLSVSFHRCSRIHSSFWEWQMDNGPDSDRCSTET